MRSRGRRPSWTKEERERVLALAEQGASQREIAEAVFGDVRYRGRVERILRSQRAASYGSAPSRNDGAEDARLGLARARTSSSSANSSRAPSVAYSTSRPLPAL